MVENEDDPELAARFEAALALRDEGKLSESRQRLVELARDYPERWAVYLMLGHLEKRLGNLEGAGRGFRRATELKPEAEIASIGLFHVLYARGELAAAFDEMRRFRRIRRSSPRYDELIADIKNEIPEDG
jgi:predicted Zn-dependent protease